MAVRVVFLSARPIKTLKRFFMRFTVGPFLPWLAVAAALTTIACSASGETPAQTAGRLRENGPPAVPVATAKVDQKSMPMAVNVIGTVEAYSNVAVHPQITGQ